VPELPEAELARQVAAWHAVLPPDVARVILDATRPPAAVRDEAMAAISTRLEGGATRRLG